MHHQERERGLAAGPPHCRAADSSGTYPLHSPKYKEPQGALRKLRSEKAQEVKELKLKLENTKTLKDQAAVRPWRPPEAPPSFLPPSRPLSFRLPSPRPPPPAALIDCDKAPLFSCHSAL